MTIQVNIWREKNKKDKVNFRQILKQQLGEWKTEDEKEVIKVIQMKVELVRKVAERRSVIINGI